MCGLITIIWRKTVKSFFKSDLEQHESESIPFNFGMFLTVMHMTDIKDLEYIFNMPWSQYDFNV